MKETVEQTPSDRVSPRYKKASVILFIWAAAATALVWVLFHQVLDLRQNIIPLEIEAGKLLSKAERKSESMLEEASEMKIQAAEMRAQAERIHIRDQQKLHEVFGDLQRYTPGRNPGAKYLDHFEVSNGRIKTFMVNRGSRKLKPSFYIRFINRYGYISESHQKIWILDSIKPNETRVDDDKISLRFGEPVYYVVDFTNKSL